VGNCGVCNATILFGGHRIGDTVFCSGRCLILGRSLVQPERQTDAGISLEAIRELREDVAALADDVQRQHDLLTDATERVDFLERALVQLREVHSAPRPPVDKP
jgi:hypothetical protein